MRRLLGTQHSVACARETAEVLKDIWVVCGFGLG